MSAELLREAAAKMRERAEAATPGPWTRPGANVFRVVAPEARHRNPPIAKTPPYPWKIVADPDPYDANSADAEHIASWHPAVALTVADGFEALADEWDADEDVHPGGFHWTVYTAMTNAARAYLYKAARRES